MTSALDRVKLVEGAPPCLPGKCSICGNTGEAGRKFLDIGLELDFYGVVYFCNLCLSSSILPHLELVPLDMLVQVQEELEEAKAATTELEIQNNELRSVLESLSKLGFNSSTDSDAASAESDVATDSGSEQSKSATTNKRSTRGKAGSVKSTNESGSTNVLNSISLTENFDL